VTNSIQPAFTGISSFFFVTDQNITLTIGLVTPPAPAMPLAAPSEEISDCRILPAFILGFLFGVFGAHRFYVGKIGTAILQLFTLGGLGIWATIDWILILCRAFKDKKGRRITQWV
jgi:hypothetical protein